MRRRTGTDGRVVDVDITDEQLAKARRLADEASFAQVELRAGYIEGPPFDDGGFDCAISSGVINLSPAKPAVFAAAARALRPGGRLALADIVSDKQMPEGVTCDASLWALYRRRTLSLVRQLGCGVPWFCWLDTTGCCWNLTRDATRQGRGMLAKSVSAKDPEHGFETVDGLLGEARAALKRLPPVAAWADASEGAALVDIRSDTQRARDGLIPGAICIPRNVLEWRCDPESPHRDEAFARRDRLLILICDEGYQSSLAAATVARFGVAATDVIGGFQAWRDGGMPVDSPPA